MNIWNKVSNIIKEELDCEPICNGKIFENRNKELQL